MDRKDGLDEKTWLEFEKVRWNRTPSLRAEFRDDFDRYWAFLQNQHKSPIIGGVVKR